MSQQGFIMLHRKVQQHWLYDEKRKFSKFEAWVDMLMMANHKANKFVLGNELISLEKGQFVTSELKLMERWDWGKAKLRSFLELLESDGMIIKKSDRKKTTITICNYGIYHGFETDNRPQTDQEQTADRPQADYEQTDNGLITDTNNNDNNVNNDKNVKNDKKEKKLEYADNVFLTLSEYDKLVDKMSEGVACDYIERLDNYIGQIGKDKYKSHYHTILNWYKKDNPNQQEGEGKNESTKRSDEQPTTEYGYNQFSL